MINYHGFLMFLGFIFIRSILNFCCDVALTLFLVISFCSSTKNIFNENGVFVMHWVHIKLSSRTVIVIIISSLFREMLISKISTIQKNLSIFSTVSTTTLWFKVSIVTWKVKLIYEQHQTAYHYTALRYLNELP